MIMTVVKINEGKPHEKWSQEALQRELSGRYPQHPSITNGKKGEKNYFNKVSLCTVLCIKFSSSQSLMILDDKDVTFLPVQRRTTFHREISSPAFKKRKEDASLSQLQCSSHRLPAANKKAPQVWTLVLLQWTTTLPNFLLKFNESWPSFCLFMLACPDLQFSALPE